MQGFTAPKSAEVILTRGDESIAFTVSPLPAGYRADLFAAFPPPEKYINGKHAGADSAAQVQWGDLFGFSLLAKALEPSGVLSSPCVNLSQQAAAIGKQARAIREEFRAAGFTDGEVAALVKALDGLNSEVSIDDLGKPPSP